MGAGGKRAVGGETGEVEIKTDTLWGVLYRQLFLCACAWMHALLSISQNIRNSLYTHTHMLYPSLEYIERIFQ